VNAGLALFLCSKFGLSDETSGLIASLFLAAIYVMSLVGGVIADRTQNYQRTIESGLVVMALGYVALSIPVLATPENNSYLLAFTIFALVLIAVGDSYNDLEMIQFAGLGVAMGNAREAVKNCADYVTKSNNEDGIAHMLEKYIFNFHEDAPYSVAEINSIFPGTLMESLGIQCTQIAKGYVEGTMPVDKRTGQPLGIIHGGANLAFAETLAGLGSVALLDEGEMQVGAQVSGNHIASAFTGDTMVGKASIMHQGRSTHVWSVEIYSEKSGKLIHTARVLNSIIKKR